MSVQVRGALPPEYAEILSPEALGLVARLTRALRSRRNALLDARRERVGTLPRFRPETAAIRDGDWRCAPLPADLLDRRVEITGPVDRKLIINALNSGANVFMADFEDSSAPTWANMIEGQINLRDAVRRQVDFTHPATGKQYTLNAETAVLMVRPRGWHLDEAHILVDGAPAPAGLVDFGLFMHHNARRLSANGSAPYFYLPKLECHEEAELWDDAFVIAQEAVGLPVGTIKATVLIETLWAAFEMDEILHALRRHSAGLNCGRWDYIFSYLKTVMHDPNRVLPDRAEVGMTQPFMAAYTRRVVQVCHRRGVHAMGGMAAQIPLKHNPAANERALAKVRADKLREVRGGHDGTWVAHPGLVQLARDVFDRHMPGPNQIACVPDATPVTEADLLAAPQGTRTEAGLRQNLRVALQYLAAWLDGNGCVPLYGLMEDAATAEISRTQVQQWIEHGARLADGRPVTAALACQLLVEEREPLKVQHGARFGAAAALLTDLLTEQSLTPFLTLPAYRHITTLTTAQEIPMTTTAQTFADTRFAGINRPYTQDTVKRLRGSLRVEHTLADRGARRLWEMLNTADFVPSLGALTGGQAVQMVRAGLPAIYVSGWQVAADGNAAGQVYPDQSLYPVNSVPNMVKRINQALLRQDQVESAEGGVTRDWFAPIIADAEAGFGGALNAYELMKAMIEAGASAVHFEDQLAAEKKCGHLGGKVLVPTSQFEKTLISARLAADVAGVPTVLIARTDANSAKLLTSDIDDRDKKWCTGERTAEGFFRLTGGLEMAIDRGLAYAPYADLVWCETGHPDLDEAKRFAEAIHKEFPGKLLAYNCSPSFNWKRHLDDATIAKFQRELGAMGYKYQFVTLAGFHSLNHGMFELARGYKAQGMTAYAALQTAEFGAEVNGYTATKHQREVGTGYFDAVRTAITGGESATSAMRDSTETEQF
jgi:malate synthase A